MLVDGHTVLLGHQHLSVLTLLLQHHEVKGKEDDETPLPWHFLYHLGAPASIRTHITKFRMSRSAASLVLSAAQTLDGLGDHGGGGAALVLPGWGQNAGQLVVPGADEISNVLPFPPSPLSGPKTKSCRGRRLHPSSIAPGGPPVHRQLIGSAGPGQVSGNPPYHRIVGLILPPRIR